MKSWILAVGLVTCLVIATVAGKKCGDAVEKNFGTCMDCDKCKIKNSNNKRWKCRKYNADCRSEGDKKRQCCCIDSEKFPRKEWVKKCKNPKKSNKD